MKQQFIIKSILQTFNLHSICDPSAIHFSTLYNTFPNTLKVYTFYCNCVYINLQNKQELIDLCSVKMIRTVVLDILIPMQGNQFHNF